MLDDVRDRMTAWLDCEPSISAVDILTRLKAAHSERFCDQHLRTVQRAVKAWRGQQARRIVMASSTAVAAGLRNAVRTGDISSQLADLCPSDLPAPETLAG
jgi:hypothetical protein